MPSALLEDGAPSAALDHVKARGSTAHPGVRPQQLNRLRWPRELASGRPHVENCLHRQPAGQLIADFQRIFRNGRLPLRLRPYRILATSPTSGLIEVVANAKSLDSVRKSVAPPYATLGDLFKRRYGGVHTPAFYRARRNFVQSVAAYSVVCYLLQIKDRHNGNILLHADGSVVGRRRGTRLPEPRLRRRRPISVRPPGGSGRPEAWAWPQETGAG